MTPMEDEVPELPNPRLDTYWVVEVTDPQDLEHSMPGYKQRFVFRGDSDLSVKEASDQAAADAWRCYANAIRAGFIAQATQTRDEKIRV
jgi:hypothetical protein